MDINNQMLTKYKKFLNDIIIVFPEHKDIINKNYNDIFNLKELKIEDNEIMCEFLDNISNISDDIMNKNESIFTDELFLTKLGSIYNGNIPKRSRINSLCREVLFFSITISELSYSVLKAYVSIDDKSVLRIAFIIVLFKPCSLLPCISNMI